MKIYRHQWIKLASVALLLLVIMPEIWAQCPMCKMTAESNLANGGTAGKGLNIGILFMLSLPYLIVGSIGFAWWRHNRRRI
ncbi:MAG: hypothetical protein KDC53_06145 [Saprospiraceae bacterium]|nr:hypothetical protein [Saprospiraceae bacterium]